MSSRVTGSLASLFRRMDENIIRELDTMLKDEGANAERHYKQVVANWRGKPRWRINVVTTSRVMQLYVRAIGDHADKWVWVDEGTGLDGPNRRKYPIRPRTARALRFQTGHNPKTAPIARGNVGDGSSSGNWITTQEVMHPGITARKFGDTYFQDDINVQELTNEAIRRGVRRTR